ncbi:hypothetical protein [Helicobacter didelphidarum]|uniref:hypothetical protein n=1 Tax=Helicobacter didelphidarum TaxID=2040648 RepID=UPI001FE572DC|nr:hypothetical protein [Helicobacter didelphidarum]
MNIYISNKKQDLNTQSESLHFSIQNQIQRDLQDSVFLAQTDTTIGFLSKNPHAINTKKGANNTKPLLREFSSFNNLPYRIPSTFRAFVRHARKKSFILPNNASFRIIKEPLHRDFLQCFQWLYSSSANPTTQSFDLDFALKQCDIIVLDKRGLFANKSSQILKIGNERMRKIR